MTFTQLDLANFASMTWLSKDIGDFEVKGTEQWQRGPGNCRACGDLCRVTWVSSTGPSICLLRNFQSLANRST
jgi:hypothetical protein